LGVPFHWLFCAKGAGASGTIEERAAKVFGGVPALGADQGSALLGDEGVAKRALLLQKLVEEGIPNPLITEMIRNRKLKQ
jgi:hypothetical protein